MDESRVYILTDIDETKRRRMRLYVDEVCTFTTYSRTEIEAAFMAASKAITEGKQ